MSNQRKHGINRFTAWSQAKVNISESDNSFTLVMAAPGIAREQIRVSVDADQLVVYAEQGAETSTWTTHRKDFDLSDFRRSFKLPAYVNADEVSASYEQGLLTLHIAKTAKKQIKVQ